MLEQGSSAPPADRGGAAESSSTVASTSGSPSPQRTRGPPVAQVEAADRPHLDRGGLTAKPPRDFPAHAEFLLRRGGRRQPALAECDLTARFFDIANRRRWHWRLERVSGVEPGKARSSSTWKSDPPARSRPAYKSELDTTPCSAHIQATPSRKEVVAPPAPTDSVESPLAARPRRLSVQNRLSGKPPTSVMPESSSGGVLGEIVAL